MKVMNSNMSHLEAHAGFFRLLMNFSLGNFLPILFFVEDYKIMAGFEFF